MTDTRPETVADGLTHRHGCTTPRPIVTPSTLRGWNFRRCTACGAVKLERARS